MTYDEEKIRARAAAEDREPPPIDKWKAIDLKRDYVAAHLPKSTSSEDVDKVHLCMISLFASLEKWLLRGAYVMGQEQHTPLLPICKTHLKMGGFQ